MNSKVNFISHRGESHDAPENTLAAFKLAFERGSDGVECDVHLTADNLVVVAHDWSTHRMGDKAVALEESEYNAIKDIDVSGSHLEYSPARIPLLHELLDIMPEKSLFYLELKGNNPKLVDFVAEILRKYPHLQPNITI
ncbi:MAG: glycerophosphodiester phosphodiesterase family protein, partial [Victivallaceae bacterium]